MGLDFKMVRAYSDGSRHSGYDGNGAGGRGLRSGERHSHLGRSGRGDLRLMRILNGYRKLDDKVTFWFGVGFLALYWLSVLLF